MQTQLELDNIEAIFAYIKDQPINSFKDLERLVNNVIVSPQFNLLSFIKKMNQVVPESIPIKSSHILLSQQQSSSSHEIIHFHLKREENFLNPKKFWFIFRFIPHFINLFVSIREELKDQNGVFVPVPNEGCIFIGDIHGNMASFEQNLNLFLNSQKNAVCGGDYIDRGPDSEKVLVSILILKMRFPDRFVPLRGNHEHNLGDSLYERYCDMHELDLYSMEPNPNRHVTEKDRRNSFFQFHCGKEAAELFLQIEPEINRDIREIIKDLKSNQEIAEEIKAYFAGYNILNRQLPLVAKIGSETLAVHSSLSSGFPLENPERTVKEKNAPGSFGTKEDPVVNYEKSMAEIANGFSITTIMRGHDPTIAGTAIKYKGVKVHTIHASNTNKTSVGIIYSDGGAQQTLFPEEDAMRACVKDAVYRFLMQYGDIDEPTARRFVTMKNNPKIEEIVAYVRSARESHKDTPLTCNSFQLWVYKYFIKPSAGRTPTKQAGELFVLLKSPFAKIVYKKEDNTKTSNIVSLPAEFRLTPTTAQQINESEFMRSQLENDSENAQDLKKISLTDIKGNKLVYIKNHGEWFFFVKKDRKYLTSKDGEEAVKQFEFSF